MDEREPIPALPSEVAAAMHRLVDRGFHTLDSLIEMVDQPEKEEMHRALFELSGEQLAKLDVNCPKSIDLTIAEIEKVR